MSKRSRTKVVGRPVKVDPKLQQQWEDATARLSEMDQTTWNNRYGELADTYNTAVEKARTDALTAKRAKRRQRLVAAIAIVVVLAFCWGGVRWVITQHNRPSKEDVAVSGYDNCLASLAQSEHVRFVDKQIDLLADGEAGWVINNPYGISIQAISLYPGELSSGKNRYSRSQARR